MLKAIIQHGDDTVITRLPCDRMKFAQQLASIGISSPAHQIRCEDEDANPIKVKIIGESEFENKLASLFSSEHTLSFANTVCEIYQSLPYQNKLDAMEVLLKGQVESVGEFSRYMVETRMQDTIEHYYCPLVARVYSRNEYGDYNDFPDEYDGSYLAPYEERIRELIYREEARDDENLAEYFDGSNSISAKLKEIHFGTQNVCDTLYGHIRTELTDPFTADEEVEFKAWLEGQCSDGYGEGLEQRPISIEDGEMFVSFWNDENYFLLGSDEFDEYLSEQSM